MERFLNALESVGLVPFSGEFEADGTWHAPYSGPGMEGLLGGELTADASSGAVWESRVVAADRPRYALGMAQQRRGESCQMEYRIATFDGGERWIRECTRARRLPRGRVRVDGVLIDVSEHRHAVDELEAALRLTRERLDSVLGALEEYLYAWRFPAHGPAVIDFESIPQSVFLQQEPGGVTPEEEWLRAVLWENGARLFGVQAP